MSETPATTPRLSPFLWLLLLIPAALVGGWFIGKLPGGSVPPPKTVTSEGGPTSPAPPAPSTTTDVTPVQAPMERVSPTETRDLDPPRAAVERPKRANDDAEYSQWTSLDNAMAESRRNGKPIFIDFSADWCGPCQRLKQQVFEDGERGRVLQSAVIPVSIVDRRRETGSNPPEIESLQEKFQVDAFPTLVVFSPQNGRAMRTQGFGDADQTLTWITEAAKALR
jgi:thiol-disulfide isomerase/thioredoxin